MTIQELVEEYQKNPTSSLKEDICDLMKPFLWAKARKYAKSSFSADDLFTEGCIGLLNALDNYSVDKGASFMTYATTKVLGDIKRALRDKRELIRRPAWIQEFESTYYVTYQNQISLLKREPNDREMAEAMKLELESYIRMKDLSTSKNMCSLDIYQENVTSHLEPKAMLDGSPEQREFDENDIIDLKKSMEILDQLVIKGNVDAISKTLRIERKHARNLLSKIRRRMTTTST